MNSNLLQVVNLLRRGVVNLDRPQLVSLIRRRVVSLTGVCTLTQQMDFSKPDLIDSNALLFSAYVWSTIHGDKPFPKEYFGKHGKGLKALGLKIDPKFKVDND